MPRWLFITVLIAAVVCAGIGVALVTGPLGTDSFGWVAYSPLSHTTYRPDLTWLVWAPRLGTTLTALGAGTTGALLATAGTQKANTTRR